MTTEIPKRPDPAKDTWRTIDLLDHEHAVARVAVEALDRLVNHLAVTRHNGWQRCCSAERDAAREALAKIEASGWKP